MSFPSITHSLSDDKISSMISTLDNVNTCVFTKDELKFLCIHFQSLSNGNDSINRECFQKALILKSSALIDNIYRVFDEDKDDCISFKEYIANLILMSPMASYDEKLKFSFNIYDKDGDGYISHDDLKTVITAIMTENGLVATDNNIQELLGNTNTIIYPNTNTN